MVNIIGLGAGWKEAPLEGLSWGINTANQKRPIDVMFNLHDLPDWFGNGFPPGSTKTPEMINETIRIAKENNTPFYSLSDYEINGFRFKRFPIESIVAEFNDDFFSSSVDFLIAFAIYSNFKRINVYGVNMTHGSEYTFQRPGVEYWRGYAKGRGLRIEFHGEICQIGKISKRFVYGYNIKQEDFKKTVKEGI